MSQTALLINRNARTCTFLRLLFPRLLRRFNVSLFLSFYFRFAIFQHLVSPITMNSTPWISPPLNIAHPESTTCICFPTTTQVRFLHDCLDSDQMCLNACGFFKVNLTLLVSVRLRASSKARYYIYRQAVEYRERRAQAKGTRPSRTCLEIPRTQRAGSEPRLRTRA